MLDFLQEEGIDPRVIQDRGIPAPLRAVRGCADAPPLLLLREEGLGAGPPRRSSPGENLLLAGAKATGKNVLAENLAVAFGRPVCNISLHINADATTMLGTDTFGTGR